MVSQNGPLGLEAGLHARAGRHSRARAGPGPLTLFPARDPSRKSERGRLSGPRQNLSCYKRRGPCRACLPGAWSPMTCAAGRRAAARWLELNGRAGADPRRLQACGFIIRLRIDPFVVQGRRPDRVRTASPATSSANAILGFPATARRVVRGAGGAAWMQHRRGGAAYVFHQARRRLGQGGTEKPRS